LRKPTEFGYVVQLAELCENTRRGARGLILPAASGIGSLNESQLLPTTGNRLRDLGLRPREIALDGGFTKRSVAEHLPTPERLFISGRHAPHVRKTNRRLAKFRVGAEGRISHLKRAYGPRPIQAQGPRRRSHLDRLGAAGLQPRHPRPAIRPGRLTP
jgi:hypothetical protein